MSINGLFTRDEVLGGFPARRASALLFAIESRTSHLTDQSRRATDFFLSEGASKERDISFLEAFNQGREPPLRATIQNIERYSAQWAPLVPDNPNIRAALAHVLGQKFKFTRPAVPGICTALAINSHAVQQAYRRLYGDELENVFTRQISWADQIAWLWAFLSRYVDRLTPFWLTFALTVAFSLSQAFLALPIGVAGIGPMPGAILVVAVGVLNILTMACMAEACARSGEFRYGKAFIGRLVTDYLGSEASWFFSAIAALRTFIVLLAGFIGIGLTLATFTQVRAEVWITSLLAIELYYLSRKSLTVTATTMVLLIAINVVLLLPIMVLAIIHAEPKNLLQGSVIFSRGEPFDPSVLKLVFGVIMMLYIGHVYVIQCAKIVLPRDPSARSLIRGSIAGTAFLTVLFALWLLAVTSAVAPEQLAREAGTAIAPLARQAGPVIHVLGSLLVVLLLGMSCLRTSAVLFNITQEHIPTQLRWMVTLPRQRGSLFFAHRGKSKGSPLLALTYLGLSEGQPRFRLDLQIDSQLHRMELKFAKYWDATAIREQLQKLSLPGFNLSLEVVDVASVGVCLQVNSTLRLWYEGEWHAGGLHVADVGSLKDPLRQLLNWMTRQGEVSLAEVTTHAGENEWIALLMVEELIAMGFVETLGTTANRRYRTHLAARRGRRLPQEIWHALESTGTAPSAAERLSHGKAPLWIVVWARAAMLSEGGRFFLSVSPVLLVFFLSEWLLLTGSTSFAQVLGFGGVIANTVTAGIFPVLLLVSSRRKGECKLEGVFGFLDHRLFTSSLYLVFLLNLIIHGIFIYPTAPARGTALAVAVIVVVVSVLMVRRKVFGDRLILELREESEGAQGFFAAMKGGQPVIADVTLGLVDGEQTSRSASGTVRRFSRLRYVAFKLQLDAALELKVWAHRITREGNSQGLPARVEIISDNERSQWDLTLSEGQAIIPVKSGDCAVRVALAEAAG